jgi:putative copper export protein
MASVLPYLRFVHLVAAATWLGGLIVLGALVPALRKAGADVELLRAAARRFAVVSWTAMGLAVAAGLLQVVAMHLPWTYGRLHVKITLVVVAIALAGFHQVTAKRASPRSRGIVQGLILLVSLGIFGAAVWL